MKSMDMQLFEAMSEEYAAWSKAAGILKDEEETLKKVVILGRADLALSVVRTLSVAIIIYQDALKDAAAKLAEIEERGR